MSLGSNKKTFITLTEWVKLQVEDPSGLWTSHTVCALIAPNLCSPIILGLPFLAHNNIVVDHAQMVIDKTSGFDLLILPLYQPLSPKETERLI
jgi:hypothetical protein